MDTTRNTIFIIRGNRRFAFQETLAAGKLIHEIIWDGNSKKIDFVFKIDLSRPLMKLGERDFHRQVNDGFLRVYDISRKFQKKFEIPKSGSSHEPYLILKPNHGYQNKEEIIKDLVEFGAEKKQDYYIDMISNDSESQPKIIPDTVLNEVSQKKDLIALCWQGKNEEVVKLLTSSFSQNIPILEKVVALDLLHTMNALIYNEQRMNAIKVLVGNVFFSLKSTPITIEEKQKTYGIMNQSIHREYYQLFMADLIQDFKIVSNVYYNESEIRSAIFVPMYAQGLADNALLEVNDEYSSKRKNNISKLWQY